MTDEARQAHLVETPVGQEQIYNGRIITVEQLEVKLPNGRLAKREIVHHPGAVGILAETNDGNILVVQQWRMPLKTVLLEIPAGKLEPGEDPRTCATRELEEETGYQPSEMRQIAQFATSPGFSDEIITLFYAAGLTKGTAALDEDEFLDVESLTPEQVQELIRDQRITDGKTLVAMQWWLSQRKAP